MKQFNSIADEYLELDDQECKLHTIYANAISNIREKKAKLLYEIKESLGSDPITIKLTNAEIIQKRKTKYSIYDRSELNKNILKNPQLLSMYKAEVVSSKVEELIPDIIKKETGQTLFGLNKNVFITTQIKHKR